MEQSDFFRVEEQERDPGACQCPGCKLWTVAYEDGEPTEIGTAYQGGAGKEAAEDVCDLMNMAYDLRGEEVDRLRSLLGWAYGKLDAFGVGKTMAEGHPSTLRMDEIKLEFTHSAGPKP